MIDNNAPPRPEDDKSRNPCFKEGPSPASPSILDRLREE